MSESKEIDTIETEEMVSCLQCGDTIPLEESSFMDEDTLCEDCYNERTTTCACCNEHIWNSNDYGDDNISLCERCRYDHYTTCDECGTLLYSDDAHYEENDDDMGYCAECFQKIQERPIHSYSYKPEPIFWGTGKRFLGVELEVDKAGQSNENAKKILEILNKEKDLGYIKTDGSLDDGMELVLHPMTLEFHSQEMPWREVLSLFRRLGYYSHCTQTCGLHVHVNRTSLGKTLEQQEDTIANILYLFERFWEELLVFSRRTERQVQRWAARYGYKQSGKEILEHVKKSYPGRYTSVNLTNTDTIEFRIFRGTLKHNTIMATLQMISQICNVAFSMPEEELKQLGWTQLILSIEPKTMPELVQYLKERNLYVNEPIVVREKEA